MIAQSRKLCAAGDWGVFVLIFSDNSDNTLYKNKEDLKLKFLLRY